MSLLDAFRRRLAGPAPTPPVAPALARVDRPPPPIASLAARLGTPRGFPNLPGSDRGLLARVGAITRARLDADPAVAAVPATNLDMYIARDFLTAEQCAALIALIDADVRPSTSLRAAGVQANRTSETCRLAPDAPLVAEVEARIGALLGIAPDHGETIQGQRYLPGQRFKMHNDYFAGGQPYSAVVAGEGGQRTWTAMIYLDRPEAGGATSFPHAGVSVSPWPGALLTWNNMDRAGDPKPYSHHEGTPVTAGVKHVLTKWFANAHGPAARPRTRSARRDSRTGAKQIDRTAEPERTAPSIPSCIQSHTI